MIPPQPNQSPRLFRRGFPNSTLEHSLDALLSELGDESPFVEWWARDEWINLDAHRDIDELLARQGGPHRTPNHGHVLYLAVGAAVAEQGGPTVLWPHAKVGSDNAGGGGVGGGGDNGGGDTRAGVAAFSDALKAATTAMIVVPARPSRLLRFSGDIMHSVPRPPLSYIDLDEGGTGGRIHTRVSRMPGDEESTLFRRSVVLFVRCQAPHITT